MHTNCRNSLEIFQLAPRVVAGYAKADEMPSQYMLSASSRRFGTSITPARKRSAGGQRTVRRGRGHRRCDLRDGAGSEMRRLLAGQDDERLKIVSGLDAKSGIQRSGAARTQ